MVTVRRFIAGAFVGSILGFAIGFIINYLGGWTDSAIYYGFAGAVTGMLVGGILVPVFQGHIPGLVTGGFAGLFLGVFYEAVHGLSYRAGFSGIAISMWVVIGCIVGGLGDLVASRESGNTTSATILKVTYIVCLEAIGVLIGALGYLGLFALTI